MSTLIYPGVLALIFISQLGSPSFHKRELAMQALNQMAPLIVPYLEAAHAHPDPEVARRVHLVLASYYEKAADHLLKEAKPTSWPRMPWIDMLPKDYPDRADVIEYFVALARDKIGRKGPPDWEDYRLATELLMHDLLRRRHTLKQVVELLDRMAAQEQKWIAENGKNYSPPVQMPTATGQ
jgi:hypothetical protein